MPFLLPVIQMVVSTLGGTIATLAAKWFTKLATGPAAERLALSVLEELAKKTDSNIDDQIVAELKKKTEE